MKKLILKLNANWFPCAVAEHREVIKNICSGTVFPLDTEYSEGDDGELIMDACTPIKTWEEWLKLPIRDYDEYWTTPNSRIRIPTVVLCASHKKIVFRKVLFPTNKNIWERDNYTCGYTGKKLNKNELSVDHIIPTSRGGEDSWLNKVTCDRILNSKKGSLTPEEAGLKLKFKPFVPKFGALDIAITKTRREWAGFLNG